MKLQHLLVTKYYNDVQKHVSHDVIRMQFSPLMLFNISENDLERIEHNRGRFQFHVYLLHFVQTDLFLIKPRR